MRLVLLVVFAGCSGQIYGYSTPETPTDEGAPADSCAAAAEVVAVPIARLTPRRFAGVVGDLFSGVQASGFPSAGKGAPYSTTAAYTRVSEVEAEPLLDVALAVSMQVVDRVPVCAGDEAGCARAWLTTTGAKALRRPATSDELAEWSTLFADARASGMSYGEAVGVAVMAMVQSPAFLYAFEPLPDAGSRALTVEEARTRLAFTFFEGLPDAPLSTLASVEPQALRAESVRLLSTARGRAVLRGFLREWLGVDGFHSTVHDSGVQAALEEELERVLGEALDADDGFERLMTSQETWVNGTLQRFYGLAVTSTGPTDWKRVTLPAEQRAGILTHPLVMARLAHGPDASMVFRGIFVRRALLCEEIPPPPGDPFQLQASVGTGDGTSSGQSNARLAAPQCAGCHRRIDPIGAGFAAFDGAGHFDAAAQVHGELLTSNDEVAGPFSGPRELGAKLAASPKARACFARQWLRFVAGKTEAASEACAMVQASESLTKVSTRLPAQFAEAAGLPFFSTRWAEVRP